MTITVPAPLRPIQPGVPVTQLLRTSEIFHGWLAVAPIGEPGAGWNLLRVRAVGCGAAVSIQLWNDGEQPVTPAGDQRFDVKNITDKPFPRFWPRARFAI